jgi:hypothetical protein
VAVGDRHVNVSQREALQSRDECRGWRCAARGSRPPTVGRDDVDVVPQQSSSSVALAIPVRCCLIIQFDK